MFPKKDAIMINPLCQSKSNARKFVQKEYSEQTKIEEKNASQKQAIITPNMQSSNYTEKISIQNRNVNDIILEVFKDVFNDVRKTEPNKRTSSNRYDTNRLTYVILSLLTFSIIK